MLPLASRAVVESFQPRTWQVGARAAVESYTGTKDPMVVAATGTGKTALGHYLGIPRLERGERGLWIAHRTELVTQPLRALQRWWPHISGGIVQAGRNEVAAQMVYACKDTLYNTRLANPLERLEQIFAHGAPSFAVIDEAHYSLAKSWTTIMAYLKERGVRLIGLTATPDRADNKRLTDWWEIVYAYPIVDAIEAGDLVPPYLADFPLPDFDASKVPTVNGEYDQEALARELLERHVVPHTIEALRATHLAERLPKRDHSAYMRAQGKAIMVVTATVHQARLTAEALNEAGFVARVVWGEMPDRDRARLLKMFGAGKIDVLVNADLLTVGFDEPRLSVIVLAKKVRACAKWMQIVGRGVRTFDDKDSALIIDLCGSSADHSIVSAPVLVDGIDCPVAADGRHRFFQVEGSVEGRCRDCGTLIRCMRNLGGHDFVDGRCRYCDTPQCKGSPDAQHEWVPWDDGKRICVHCAMEIPDTLMSLARRYSSQREPVAWERLICPGHVEAVLLGQIGTMFKVTHDDGLVSPFLWTCNRLYPLARAAVDEDIANALTDDVARRTKKVKGFFGGSATKGAASVAVMRAEALAKRLRIWRVRIGSAV